MQHDFLPGLLVHFRQGGIEAFRRHNAHTRFKPVGEHQADDQCKCGDDFKIQQRFPAHTAYLFQVGMAGNTRHERREKQGRDHRFDHLKEYLAQEMQLGPHLRKIIPDLRSDKHRDQDGRCQVPFQDRVHDQAGQRKPAEANEHTIR